MGFVCSGGFGFENKTNYILVDGKDLYDRVSRRKR